jgi:hypothetical protein
MTDEKVDRPIEIIPKINREESEILKQILEAIRQIKYGHVQITIQDARVVQIDRTEKQRFDRK